MLAACLLAWVTPRPACGQELAAIRADTEWLAGFASRCVGTEGHDRAQAELLARLQAIPGVTVHVQEFPVVVPTVMHATLTTAEDCHSLYPLWPDLVRLKTTPEDGLEGRLIYVGAAEFADLPARSLRGQIAVMEMSHYENWRNPFTMGAAAVLCLGGPDDQRAAPAQQPLYKPRYYVPEGALADGLRAGVLKRARIDCDAAWTTVTARNLIAAVPGTSAATMAPVAVAAPYDAMSIVMGLAPGADNALDTAFTLEHLRRVAGNPPARSMLFAFIDAYGVNQRGMREFMQLLASTPADRTRQQYEKLDAELLESYRSVGEQVDTMGDDLAAMAVLHDRRQFRELQRYLKDTLGTEIIQAREQSGKYRIALAAAGKAGQDPETPRRALNETQDRLAFLSTTLSEILTQAPISDASAPTALAHWQLARERARVQLAALEQQTGHYADLDALREAINASLGLTAGTSRGVSFVFGVDLSDAGTKVGPALRCQHLESTESVPARDFLRWLKPLIRKDGVLTDDPSFKRAAAVNAIRGVENATAFNAGGYAVLTSPARSFTLSAVTWRTLDGLRTLLDTPQDRADRLDWSRLAPQVAFTARVLDLLSNDPGFVPDEEGGPSTRPRWRHPRGTIVSESLAETVPRTPQPGMLTTIMLGRNDWPGLPACPGVRLNEFVLTGPDGRFQFPPIAGQTGWNRRRGLVQSYGLDDRGQIVKAISDSSSMLAGRVSASIDLHASPTATPVRSVTFDCVELDGPLFFDPRFLEPLNQFRLLDVNRGGAPKRYHFSVHEGQMCGLLMEDTRWQLIMRAGAAAKRMALMNIPPELLTDEDMTLQQAMRVGFTVGEPLPSIPAHVSARDFHRVDLWRRDQYEKAGIISRAVNDLLDETTRLLAEADDALERDDGAALQRAAAGALANEIRAYEALQFTADDVTRGAVFLMLLLVPFAVAMERLIFAFTRIHSRIAGAIGIFTVMTGILWSFHPAFRITSQPLIILMAFSILLLSMAVIIIIMRKFEQDLEELRSGRAEASGAETRRGGVIGSAVWLGIANMRKRKLRTTLTALTIVLITFALLCFSSSSTYQTRRELSVRGVKSPYPGVLIRLPGMQEMASRAADTVQNLVKGRYVIAPRYWWTSRESDWRLHVLNPASGNQVSLKAALGLSPNEDQVTGPGRFMPDWACFADGDGCYVSETTAGLIGVMAGDDVVVAGRKLTLLGTFPAAAVERDLRMLNGRSMLPFDFTVETDESTGQDAMQAQLASGQGLADEGEVACVSGDDLVVVHQSVIEEVGSLRSIGVRCDDDASAMVLAEMLMKVLAFPMYVTTADGVKAMVATPLIAKPPRNLLVPLLIAALIIFNTMVSSVAERKSEIHIYTSLGLAPRHVGVLFVAEAVTYGLLGTISGYVLGQGLATILTHFDLMGGITLNYSGTNVMMTMGLVLLVVVLSAIVPAIMAGRLATPSKDMIWRVPDPVDGVIRDLLPFTVTLGAAKGLVAFIHEFMDAHREGCIGNFSADSLELLPATSEIVTGLSGVVWLAPYDLGVRQEFRITITPETEDICNIRIELIHGSGQPRNWWRLNRAFLGDLRNQLLGWRRVSPERIMAYVEHAEAGIRNAE